MSGFLLLIAVLLVIVIALNLATRADPGTVSKVIRYGGASLAAIGGLVFALTGRFGFAVPLFVFAYWLIGRPWSSRPRAGIGGPGQRFGTAGGSSGQSSAVETAYLSMRLEHDTGGLSGVVKAGQFRGADLADLSLEELLRLLREVSGDADSVRLLETFLDRTQEADWRAAASKSRSSGGAMTRQRACEILGVRSGAGAEEIRAAYKVLMRKLHPDHGGSTHLAAEVNAAKDFLLGE